MTQFTHIDSIISYHSAFIVEQLLLWGNVSYYSAKISFLLEEFWAILLHFFHNSHSNIRRLLAYLSTVFHAASWKYSMPPTISQKFLFHRTFLLVTFLFDILQFVNIHPKMWHQNLGNILGVTCSTHNTKE